MESIIAQGYQAAAEYGVIAILLFFSVAGNVLLVRRLLQESDKRDGIYQLVFEAIKNMEKSQDGFDKMAGAIEIIMNDALRRHREGDGR